MILPASQAIKKCLTVLTAFLLIASVAAHAQEEVGLEILDTCNSEQRALAGDPVSSVRYGLCLGYLKGVADSLNGQQFCMPPDADTHRRTQLLKQVYIQYARVHLDQLYLPASRTVIPAFVQAFPCKQ